MLTKLLLPLPLLISTDSNEWYGKYTITMRAVPIRKLVVYTHHYVWPFVAVFVFLWISYCNLRIVQKKNLFTIYWIGFVWKYHYSIQLCNYNGSNCTSSFICCFRRQISVCVPSKTAQGATIPFSEEVFFFWKKLHCICQILFLQKYIYPKDAT